MDKPETEILNFTYSDRKALPEKPPNILVIDDDRVLLELFEKIFKKLGLGVVLTNNGKEAVDWVKKTAPDVILLDIKMPGVDGITALKEIKAVDPDVEVIIMTGYASLDSALEAINLGAFDYLKKPFENLDQVVNVVRRAWERRKPSMERQNVKASLERRIYELKLLYNTSRSLIYCSDQMEMMTLLLESLSKIIGYDLGVIVLAEKPDQKQLFLQVVNSSTAQLVEETKLNLIDAFNSVSRTSLLRNIGFDRILGEENIKLKNPGEEFTASVLNSFLNVPLMEGGKMIGMVNISSQRDLSFSSDDISLIYSMVSQIPPALQKLNNLKSAEQGRLAKLMKSRSDGVIITNENFEVMVTNPVAQTFLGKENPDAAYVQDSLGQDFRKLKAQMDQEQLDRIKKKVIIMAQNYEVVFSIIKNIAEGFTGFMISILPITKQKRNHLASAKV